MRYLLIIFTLFLFSCSTSYDLKPVIKDSNMEMFLDNGKQFAISYLPKTQIALTARKKEDKLYLFIAYKNVSNKNINVMPEEILVSRFNSAGKTKSFKTYSAEQYLKKIKTQQAWASGLQSFSDGVSSSNAGKKTTTTMGGGTGSGLDWGTTTTTTDENAKAEAKEKNAQNARERSERNAKKIAKTEQGLIKSNTLFPDDSIEGNVVIKMSQGYESKFIISVPIGTEIHSFTFIPK